MESWKKSSRPAAILTSEEDKQMTADVMIENHGSIALFTPMTPDAHQWVEENANVEPWQRIGCSIACEPRCLDQIVEGMQESGLVVG
jgi:hypothetical protein